MTKQITVRPALDSDLHFIVNELKAFAQFLGTKTSLFPDESYAYTATKNLIDNHVLLVAESESGLMGFIAGNLHNHLFNPSIRVLDELFWWVKEAYRGSRAGLMLLNEFTRIGKMKADWIFFSTVDGKTKVNDRSIIKRGYRLQDRLFLLEVR